MMRFPVRRGKCDFVAATDHNLIEGHMIKHISFALLVAVVAVGCYQREATAPQDRTNTVDIAAAANSARLAADIHPNAEGQVERKTEETSSRAGELHITKECSSYTGLAGQFCTITSSNLKQIAVGSTVVYAKGAGATSLDSDIALYQPGHRNDVAFGHVTLDFVKGRGLVTFSGGTGRFRGFRARADVAHLTETNWAWDGTYSFVREGDTE